MVTDDQKIRIVRYLDDYCFQKVWNSIRSEYRGNFVLTPLRPKLQTNNVVLTNTVVGLPTTGSSYMTYLFSNVLFQGALNLPAGEWIDLATIANLYDVKLTVYDAGGFCTPMGRTYVRRTMKDLILVAVEKTAMMKCLPNGFSSTLYMTVFRNPISTTTNFSASSTYLTKANSVDKQIADCQSNAVLSTIVINGISYSPTDVPKRSVGDFVDIFTDPEISEEYVVAVDDNSTGYMSTRYSGYREILHCPKALNPNQYLFTHDSATLFVRDPVTRKSVYLHRVDPVSVKQITHNDLSVSRDTLNGFKDALGCTNVEVVVKVRFHSDPQVLMTDSAWISDLYLSNDSSIISHLRGSLDSTLTFWKASSLEQSGYIQMMFDVDNTLNADRLDSYVASLGYYSVGAILSANIYKGIYSNADLICTKPFILNQKDVTPLVYVNGKKIIQSKITTNEYSNQRIGVSIASGTASAGDEVVINIVEKGTANPVRFTPSSDKTFINLNSSDVFVYRENQLTTPVSGYDHISSVAYELISPGSTTYTVNTNQDGTVDLTFVSNLVGQTFIITQPYFLFHEELSLDTYLADIKPLIVPLHTLASDGTDVPLLGYSTVNLFINGYRLVENIDYVLSPLTTQSGTSLIDIVILNENYIDLTNTGNVLEIIAHTGYTASTDFGYAKNNILAKNSTPSIWYPQVGLSFIEGKLTTDLLDYAVYMTPVSGQSVPNGNLFIFQTVYPKIVAELLADYSPATDNQILIAIDKYLGRSAPTPPAVLPVTAEHVVYSPYITAIIHDILSGKFSPVNDPNDNTFLAQFSSYDYLAQRDPTLADGNSIDRNFVAVNACYSQVPATTVTIMTIIQRLIKLRLVTAGSDLGVTWV